MMEKLFWEIIALAGDVLHHLGISLSKILVALDSAPSTITTAATQFEVLGRQGIATEANGLYMVNRKSIGSCTVVHIVVDNLTGTIKTEKSVLICFDEFLPKLEILHAFGEFLEGH